MMKPSFKQFLLKIYKWIILSIILQVAILVFINNFYLSDRSGNRIQVVPETSNGQAKIEKKIECKLPANVSHIKLSYDSSLAAYFLNGKLEIYSILDKKTVKSISKGKDTISYFEWLPDRNMVIYSLKGPAAEQTRVQVATYNVDSEVEHVYPKIVSNLTRDSEIVEIVLSPLTNVVYVKIKLNDLQSRIYKYNIMDELFYVMDTGAKTIIRKLNFSENLVYSDDKGNVYIKDGIKKTDKELNFKKKAVLLSVDSEDRVYVGTMENNGAIEEVYFGKIDTDTEKWEKVAMKKPAPATSVIVTRNGWICENAEDEKAIYNISKNKKMSYSGKLVDITEEYAVSYENESIIMNPLKW